MSIHPLNNRSGVTAADLDAFCQPNVEVEIWATQAQMRHHRWGRSQTRSPINHRGAQILGTVIWRRGGRLLVREEFESWGGLMAVTYVTVRLTDIREIRPWVVRH